MKRYNKFETIYRDARLYVGSQHTKNSIRHQREIYLTFRQEIGALFNITTIHDRNDWVFVQNELKEKHNGKESLKRLCEALYFNAEADYLSQN